MTCNALLRCDRLHGQFKQVRQRPNGKNVTTLTTPPLQQACQDMNTETALLRDIQLNAAQPNCRFKSSNHHAGILIPTTLTFPNRDPGWNGLLDVRGRLLYEVVTASAVASRRLRHHLRAGSIESRTLRIIKLLERSMW